MGASSAGCPTAVLGDGVRLAFVRLPGAVLGDGVRLAFGRLPGAVGGDGAWLAFDGCLARRWATEGSDHFQPTGAWRRAIGACRVRLLGLTRVRRQGSARVRLDAWGAD